MANYTLNTVAKGNREYVNILDKVELIIDMKRENGLNPGGAFLASIASCKLVCLLELKNKYNMDIEDAKIEISGITENGPFLEGTHQPISSFKEINIKYIIKSSNTDEEINEYLKVVNAACTVGNSVRHELFKEITFQRV